MDCHLSKGNLGKDEVSTLLFMLVKHFYFQLEQNLQKLDREIETLRAAVADKINPTKLVETRLETRTRRPVLERVQDKPMRGLIEEFERVHLSHNMLEKKLEEAL